MGYIKRTVRKLRRKSTPAERIMWEALRHHKLNGWEFRRQYPVGICYTPQSRTFFVLDFYCKEARLGIELDGSSHNGNKDYDVARDLVISSYDIQIIRFENGKIERNLPETLVTILNALELRKNYLKNKK
ncbi:MAG TPA: endonuclease domain-containing protein [Chitinophagales bacterium]|nr:endonuclease domain-containing protein [Chitinophagales bacterium]